MAADALIRCVRRGHDRNDTLVSDMESFQRGIATRRPVYDRAGGGDGAIMNVPDVPASGAVVSCVPSNPAPRTRTAIG